MYISYEGIGHQSVTLPANDCLVGKVCKVDAMGKAAKCAEGDKFCGLTEAVEKEMAAVQMEGFVQVNYSGSKPALGYTKLVADSTGGVKVNDAGREYLVVYTNVDDMTAVIKL